jgi:hypothetical protein
MNTVAEFWKMAQDLYARARSSIDPTTKRMLLRATDNYMKKAQEIRRAQITKADYPKPVRKVGLRLVGNSSRSRS